MQHKTPPQELSGLCVNMMQGRNSYDFPQYVNHTKFCGSEHRVKMFHWSEEPQPQPTKTTETIGQTF